MHYIDTTSARTVIVGDFNMKSIMSKSMNYNQNITDDMFHKYNMKQFVHDYTTVHNSILGLCFSTHDTEIPILWNHWSDHKIISFPIMWIIEKCVTLNLVVTLVLFRHRYGSKEENFGMYTFQIEKIKK